MRTPKGNGVTLSARRRERVCEGSHGDGFPQHDWQIIRDVQFMDGVRVVECVRCGETVAHVGRTR
jgi:hypothetical protein